MNWPEVGPLCRSDLNAQAPKALFANEQASQWIAAFVDWYNHRQRHSGIKFLTPQQWDNEQAVEINRQRGVVYNEPGSSIQGNGHDQHGAGVNRRWFRSISHQVSSMKQGSYR